MDVSLVGRVALVTGASKGIGKAIAQAYADAGASVLLSSRKREALEEAAAEIGGDVAVYPAHAGDPEQAAAAVAHCVERFGGVDILVNNAATNRTSGRPWTSTSSATTRPARSTCGAPSSGRRRRGSAPWPTGVAR